LGAGVAGHPVVPPLWPSSARAAAQSTAAWAAPRKEHRCLYNIELLRACEKSISSQRIKAIVEKLAGTDVDAIMCCPQAWRTNMFPSEVDPEWKKFTHIRDIPKFPVFDYVMKYIHDGGDPVRDILEASRGIGVDFFVSYRMNDWHNIQDKTFPTHNAFWREHPEYWLGDRDVMGMSDNLRLLNYMIPKVREHYYAIIAELCTNYDIDGLELDFQRVPRFFHNSQIAEGMPVMTALVQRFRDLLDKLGKERGKSLKLCARVPDTIAACKKAGLDVLGWDALGLMDMFNVSPFFIQSTEIGIEEFKAGAKRAKIIGEINYLVAFTDTVRHGTVSEVNKGRLSRYTTFEMYRAAAMNLLGRGADGLSVFNMDYVPPAKRQAMPEVLKRITDLDFLKTTSKDYAIYPNNILAAPTFPATDEATIKIFIGDDTRKTKFQRSVLRVETNEICRDLRIAVWLNSQRLEPCEHEDTEMFPPSERNDGFPSRDRIKFFAVPLDRLALGYNRIEIKNLEKSKTTCTLFSMELAMYK
jgi:hypothetical protein